MVHYCRNVDVHIFEKFKDPDDVQKQVLLLPNPENVQQNKEVKKHKNCRSK